MKYVLANIEQDFAYSVMKDNSLFKHIEAFKSDYIFNDEYKELVRIAKALYDAGKECTLEYAIPAFFKVYSKKSAIWKYNILTTETTFIDETKIRSLAEEIKQQNTLFRVSCYLSKLKRDLDGSADMIKVINNAKGFFMEIDKILREPINYKEPEDPDEIDLHNITFSPMEN